MRAAWNAILYSKKIAQFWQDRYFKDSSIKDDSKKPEWVDEIDYLLRHKHSMLRPSPWQQSHLVYIADILRNTPHKQALLSNPVLEENISTIIIDELCDMDANMDRHQEIQYILQQLSNDSKNTILDQVLQKIHVSKTQNRSPHQIARILPHLWIILEECQRQEISVKDTVDLENTDVLKECVAICIHRSYIERRTIPAQAFASYVTRVQILECYLDCVYRRYDEEKYHYDPKIIDPIMEQLSPEEKERYVLPIQWLHAYTEDYSWNFHRIQEYSADIQKAWYMGQCARKQTVDPSITDTFHSALKMDMGLNPEHYRASKPSSFEQFITQIRAFQAQYLTPALDELRLTEMDDHP